jgi:uncharacterized protein YukE
MTFQHPNAVAPVDNADLAISGDDHSKDIIGAEAINKAVEHTVPGYDEKLDLKLATSALERHSRLGGLAFGKIDKDVARLKGLAAAIENIALVVRDGKAQLAQDWKGDSYDAFRTNVEKLEKTLDDYRAAVETTAAGLETAMSNIRAGYQKYRDDCLNDHFNWGDLAPPETWWRMSADSGEYLAEHCTSWHDIDCRYNDDDVVAIIDGKLTNNPLFNDQLEKWDCTDDLAVAMTQYGYVVKSARDEREAIQGKVVAYCEEADGLRELVTNAYDASLDNLRILAEASVFSHLSVPGGTEPAGSGDPGPGGGDTGGDTGAPGGGEPGGGYPGGGGSPGPGSEAVMPPPLPNPAPEPEPAPVEPAATEPAETPGTGESVQIKDGDRTISVTSPDGEGHVTVSVAGADGKAKTYDLDFDAASGTTSQQAAGPDGAPADPKAAHVPAGTNGQCVIKDGPLTITAQRPLFDPGTIKLEVDDGVNEPTTYTLDFDEAADQGRPGDDQPADDAQPADPGKAEPAAAAKAGPAADPGTTDETTDETSADADPGTKSDAASAPAADDAPADAADGEKVQITTPAVVDEPSQLVPDQATGEAELATAGGDDPGGAAGGAGAPMMAGAGAGGATDGGRAGTGWSVHGDLFADADPVYSMHGVLGEDDFEGR